MAVTTMPTKPPLPCRAPGCRALVHDGSGYCAQHAQRAAERHARYNRVRDECDSFYGRAPWKRLRAQHLSEHPLCVECERLGRVTPATVVDHIVPRKAQPERSLDPSNLRSLCWSCHSRVGEKVKTRGG